VVTREYWDGDAQEYVSTQESMLAIKMWLETTVVEQRRIAYDSMTLLGDIGGLYDFFVVVVTPLVMLIVGDRLTFHLLSKLFMVNNPKESPSSGFSDSDDNDKSDPEAKKRRWKNWLQRAKPYKTACKDQIYHNKLFKFVTCQKICRRKTGNSQ